MTKRDKKMIEINYVKKNCAAQNIDMGNNVHNVHKPSKVATGAC